jgi:hypothetical protein
MFLEEKQDIDRYDEITNTLLGLALNEGDSRSLITRLANELEGDTGE